MKVLSLALIAVLALGMPARADFDACKARLEAEAASHGISRATLSRAFDNLEPNDAPSFLGVQPEFATPIWDYMAGLVDEERVRDGQAAFAAHRQAALAAERRFGVDAAAVVAVWGVESNFGQNFGTRPVIQSLASLVCLGDRRNDYFRGELMAALKIVDRGDVKLEDFNGSWAGAFGNTQFMPSTFLRLAVDMDGDGRRDVVGSVADALGSTANFLRAAHWNHGLPWGFEVALPGNYRGPSGRGAKRPLAVWAKSGLTRVDGSPLAGSGAFGLLLPAGRHGPAFLVSQNFEAFYAYNAAESYALAIALLSDRIKGKPGLQTPWPTDDPGLTREERREVQARLEQRGYDVGGKHDGVMGTKTREAVKAYKASAGLKPDSRAGQKVLQLLRDGR